MTYPDDTITHQESMEIAVDWLIQDDHNFRIPATDWGQGLFDSLRSLVYELQQIEKVHPWGTWIDVRHSGKSYALFGCTTCRTDGPCDTMKILDITGAK